MSVQPIFLKRDRSRRIDRYIDFFGGTASILAGLAVVGCTQLTQVADRGGIVGRVFARSTVAAEPTHPAERNQPAFSDHDRDHFFSVAWRTEDVGTHVRIAGLLENREGPEVIDVTLRIVLWPVEEMPLREALVTLPGILEKKDSRSFVVTVPAVRSPSRVSVSVYAYRFPQPGGSK